MTELKKLQNALLPQLEKAEKLRKKYRFYKIISYLMMAVMVLVPLLMSLMPSLTNSSKIYQGSPAFTYQAVIMAYSILFFVLMFFFNGQKVKYKNFEGEIIKSVFKTIAPNFTYDKMKQITSEEITESQLMPKYSQLPQYQTKYQKVYNSGIGIAVGKIGNTKVTLGDVKIINQSFMGSFYMYIPLVPHLYMAYNYIRPWLSKNHSVDNATYSFLGMFAIMDFNKRFNGNTVVLPDMFEKKLGYLAKTIQSLNFSRDQLVNLENPEFENEFVVYSTDQVEARYILSTSLMERILALKQKINRPLMLSFKNNKLYMAVQHPYGFFTLAENKNLITSNALEEFHADISTAIGIVEDLNLNTKIWGNH